LGCGKIAVAAYGVDRFIADIDRDRPFWRDGCTAEGDYPGTGNGAHLIASIFDWLAGQASESLPKTVTGTGAAPPNFGTVI
jgi:hypothetical protein